MAGPQTSTRTGPGCLVALVLLPIVIVLGLVIGTVLSQRGDDDGEKAVTLDEGTIDGVDVARRRRARRRRRQPARSSTRTASSSPAPAPSPRRTPPSATRPSSSAAPTTASRTVRVELDNGEVVEIDTVTADGVAGTFFVQVVDGDVDAEAFPRSVKENVRMRTSPCTEAVSARTRGAGAVDLSS